LGRHCFICCIQYCEIICQDRNMFPSRPKYLSMQYQKESKHLLDENSWGREWRDTVPSLANNPMGGSFVFGLLTSANSRPAFHVPASRICARVRSGTDPPILRLVTNFEMAYPKALLISGTRVSMIATVHARHSTMTSLSGGKMGITSTAG